MKKIITFNSEAKRDILDIFDKTTDKEGYIIEKDSRQKVFSPDGEPLRLKDFAGISKGSLVFITSDLPSLINLAGKVSDC